jgi:hypothetical protein
LVDLPAKKKEYFLELIKVYLSKDSDNKDEQTEEVALL